MFRNLRRRGLLISAKPQGRFVSCAARALLRTAAFCCSLGAVALAQAAPAVRPAPEAVLTFPHGSDAPTGNSRQIIDPLVVKALADPGNWVSLEAHSDDRGSRELNLALGQRRLDALERELALKGIPMQRIHSMNHGEGFADRDIQPTARIEIRIENLGY